MAVSPRRRDYRGIEPPTPSFPDLFGRPSGVQAAAPGRVNLIGEHTDYNGGFVLPVALPLRTRVELAVRADTLVRAWSANLNQPEIEEFRLDQETRGRGWLDYAQGVTREVRCCGHGGHELRGFELRVESEVPLGGGLSSSAALLVALLRALRLAFRLDVDDVQIALMARRVENDFAGAPVGIMDPMAASLGDETAALFLDTRNLSWRKVLLPEMAELVVIDSGVSHRHADGEYRLRREECERAAGLLGVSQLRDLGVEDLLRLQELPETLRKRVRHVVTENARVLAAVASLEQGDLTRLGELLDASHESLRDDYEVSLPAIDRLVELAREEPDVYGARLTGGGFGGSIVALARRGAGRRAGERIVARYREKTSRTGALLVPGER